MQDARILPVPVVAILGCRPILFDPKYLWYWGELALPMHFKKSAMKKKTLTLLAIGGILLIGHHEIRLYAQTAPGKPAPSEPGTSPAPTPPATPPDPANPITPPEPPKPEDPNKTGKPIDPTQPAKPEDPTKPAPPINPSPGPM